MKKEKINIELEETKDSMETIESSKSSENLAEESSEEGKIYLSVKKICPKCGSPYADNDYKCQKCSKEFISSYRGIDSGTFWFIFALLLPFIAIFFIFKVRSKGEDVSHSYNKGLAWGGTIYFAIIVAVSVYLSQGGRKWFV